MALVQKKVRALPIQCKGVLRLVDNGTHFLDACCHGVELCDARARFICDDVCKRGLAAARRAEKDGACKAVRFDRAAEKAAAAHNVRLANKFIQRARTHTVGKRRTFARIAGEQIHSHVFCRFHFLLF